MSASSHLRGIMIAGVLAALSLALGFVTLAMNQTASHAAARPIVPLKLRHHARQAHQVAGVAKPHSAKKTAPVRAPNPHLVAALRAGLPRSVARALAARRVAVIELTSRSDSVARLATGEALIGTALAGAAFVAVDVDANGGDVERLTRLLGKLPIAPATLVYVRPSRLSMTLTGFNDRTVVEQAIANAETPSAVADTATTTAAATAGTH